MQLSFYSQVTPEEYFKAGTEFTFPYPKTCLHPDCLIPVPPNPHGFYSRNVVSISFHGRILIRRYYCKNCGHTFSYLPSFCLPYFQYTAEVIFAALLCHFFNMLPFLKALILSLHWQRQHMQFYRRRFKANLKRIQLVLRQLIPGIVLPEPGDIKTGAQKVLSIAITGFATIQAFSTRFFTQCNNSFMAPCKLV